MNPNTSFLTIHDAWNQQDMLQEPVPFEEFEFSFGMDSAFCVPFNFDYNIESSTMRSDTGHYNNRSSSDSSSSSSSNSSNSDSSDNHTSHDIQLDPIFLQRDPLNFNYANNTSVLDENDRKAFSNFLDSFFSEQDCPQEESHSLFQSLDKQKNQTNDNDRFLHNALSLNQDNSRKRSSPSKSPVPAKRSRSHKELLTEEEKRANHIASEQKRRSTIRNGFKELSELVPTLKNINNSKSTVLFKAVEYIKYLEKRNNSLRDKIGSLEIRVKVEGRMTTYPLCPPPPQTSSSSTTTTSLPITTISSSSSLISQEPQKRPSLLPPLSTLPPVIKSENDFSELPMSARNALLAHKSQQKQLLLLQEQLQMHQKQRQPVLPPILQDFSLKKEENETNKAIST
ncbi:Putative Helix-loop-helix DNA-binding domain protein [Rhizopus microsporus]|nr:Putative Helix-loop-helix DNA-binding domain protein [Rhizopus microsporus]